MAAIDRLIGKKIGDGRYLIVGRVGEGNMGQVFRARDAHLATDVVVKFPVPAEQTGPRPEFFERFDREARSLVSLTHPHIVKVIDVGRHEGQPYVVMQYLSGGSLKDRLDASLATGRAGMPPGSLAGWLTEIAKALDFVHAQNYLHRDVKPANILFDRFGNAFLGDFGIIKAYASVGPGDSDLTAPGFLPGTPNYVAPEVVLGRPGDGRVDQYALAMTAHEVLAGTNVMTGPTVSATMVNHTRLVPPPLMGLVPGVPARTSEAILRGLAKEPRARFDTCAAFAREVLAELPAAGAEDDDLVPVLYGPGEVPTVEAVDTPPSWATNAGMTPVSGLLQAPAFDSPPPPPLLRRRLVALAAGLGALGFGLIALTAFLAGPRKHPDPAAAAAAPAGPLEINIAYGTEKKTWLEASLREYERTHDPAGVKIRLLGMGSVEGANAVLAGDRPTPIHVWSPASSAYLDVFLRDWRVRYGGNPVARAEDLALTPMVFVMWKSRHDAFIKKYGKVNFRNLAEAMHEPGGWGSIAGKPEWGLFKFGHADPAKSNSGLLALVLMAYEHAGKARGLTTADVTSPGFQAWFQSFEAALTRHGGSLTNSTGKLMEEMVNRGPSQYDGLILYENLAIDYALRARERWGELTVSYPDPNAWNEHPYYILDVPWSGPPERRAAAEFLDFLRSAPVQRRALEHGFRPANTAVPVRDPNSPVVRSESLGVRIEVPLIAEPPSADVVSNLLNSFHRIER